ncbi:MAG: ABC transporter ATP-binding protein [Candidatus Hadarchaeales archaeon]
MRSILKIEGVKKRFGGNVVLTGVDMEVEKGEIRGLIGPNGAGKTTLFNLISGIYRLDDGKIIFDGKRLDKMKQHEICRAGIARTFQIAKPILGMTVLQNVISGRIFGAGSTSSLQKATKEAVEILKFVGLEKKADVPAESLTIGDIRRLEIARAIACRPKLILLDEVLAGLSVQEIEVALDFIGKLRDEMGVTVIMVEHVMRAVMSISDRVSVLHNGKIICTGKPKQVACNKEVIESYMGRE